MPHPERTSGCKDRNNCERGYHLYPTTWPKQQHGYPVTAIVKVTKGVPEEARNQIVRVVIMWDPPVGTATYVPIPRSRAGVVRGVLEGQGSRAWVKARVVGLVLKEN